MLEGEMTQKGFPVEFRLPVALSVSGERGVPINRPALLGSMADDSEAERGRFHGWPFAPCPRLDAVRSCCSPVLQSKPSSSRSASDCSGSPVVFGV